MTIEILPNIRMVLVGTTHPGNIGAAARAMKTMGIHELVLVDPLHFPHEEATARATVHAADILDKARVVSTLPEAIADCSLIIASSAQRRSLPWPQLSMREMGVQVRHESKAHPVAVVFGREKDGLHNDELALCHYHVQIPTHESARSLNLAAALQVFCYEIMMAGAPALIEEKRDLASGQEMHLFYDHLFTTLERIGFYDPEKPKRLKERLQRLFNRARPDQNEMNILRGILTEVDSKLSHLGRKPSD